MIIGFIKEVFNKKEKVDEEFQPLSFLEQKISHLENEIFDEYVLIRKHLKDLKSFYNVYLYIENPYFGEDNYIYIDKITGKIFHKLMLFGKDCKHEEITFDDAFKLIVEDSKKIIKLKKDNLLRFKNLQNDFDRVYKTLSKCIYIELKN